VKKPRRYAPTVIVEGKSSAVPPPPAPLVIKLSAPRQTAGKAVPDPNKISSVLAIHSYIFHTTHCLFHDSGAEAVRDPRVEVSGEQGEHYDPLFTYREGDEASYFAVSKESGGDAADVGPLGVGTLKGSPIASSSFGWTTKGSASEGGPTVRVDSAKIFPMEPERTEAVVEGFQRETAAMAVEAIPSFGNILLFRE